MYISKIKPLLSKINFLFGRNPKIESRSDRQDFIPDSYKAVVTITADFELAWGWQFAKGFSYSDAINKAKEARKNIPAILDLCEKFGIPINWATVGHLFLSECSIEKGIIHPEIKRLKNFENSYWKFSNNDWFENDPHSNWGKDPEWYAPDLIKLILDAKTEHEIGCHTFSHIDCSDSICSSEVFGSEVSACKKAAKKFDLNLISFVHPGHTIGNLDKLAELGFNSFQTDYANILGYPEKHKNGLWELKRTYEFAYRKDWSVDYHIYRYQKIIERAIKNSVVCNFWFHPSLEPKFIFDVMPHIFSYISDHKNELFITTPNKYISWLNNIINQK